MVLGVVAAALSACSENDYKVYDTTQKDSVFFDYINPKQQSDTTLVYNFGYDKSDVHTVTIPVTLMGFPVTHDRHIAVGTVADSTTMVEGTHYEIVEALVPAGEVTGRVVINLLRDRDPEIQSKSFTARFVIGESEDLKSVKNSFFKLTYSDVRPTERPIWWMASWSYHIPVYSYENAQLFFDYFYRLMPEADLETFNKIIDTYGDYFVNATDVLGPFVVYEGVIRNYVCIPLKADYPDMEFYSDPNW